MAGRIGRPIFRRSDTHVAVRPIRLTPKDTIEPGQPVKLRGHQMRSLYLRRKIGPKDHPWTLQALKSQKGLPKPYITPEEPVSSSEGGEAPEIVKDGLGWTAGGQRFKTKTEATAADLGEPEKDGLVWTAGEARFKTKKEAEAYVAENWPAE